MGWVLLGALIMTAVLGWFSSQLIGAVGPGTAVLPMQPMAPGALDNTVRSAKCDGLKTALQSELRSAGACDTDKDCTVIRLDCPFTCANAVAEAHFVRIYRMQDDFTRACGTCQSACTSDPPPTACRQGRCVLDVASTMTQNRPGLPARPQLPPLSTPTDSSSPRSDESDESDEPAL